MSRSVGNTRQEPLTLGECLAWRHQDWEPAAHAAFTRASDLLAPGRHVLEVGYRSGMMACYLARHYGVRVTGYDIKNQAQAQATANSVRLGLADQLDFRVCRPEDTTSIVGAYDMVFLRSVLATLVTRTQYRAWLRWMHSILVSDGAVVALENGAGSVPVRLCRRAHRTVTRAPYYRYLDAARLRDIDEVFRSVTAEGFGRVAPLLSWSRRLHAGLTKLEVALGPPVPARGFVIAVVARK